MPEVIKLRATEKGYYKDEIIRKGQSFDWEMPEWALEGKDKCSIKEAMPPWAEALGSIPSPEPIKDCGDDVTEDQRNAKIINVVQSLDHSDDDHWTEAGEPSMAAVVDLCGFKVSRADVKVLCPDAEREE